MDEIDLCEFSYEEFVNLFFDRPDENSSLRYAPASDRWEYSNAGTAVAYLTKLFGSFPQLAQRFSLPQIDRAVWDILGPVNALHQSMWDESAPLTARVECVRAMYFVYSDFVSTFPSDPSETCFYMWWDLVCDSFWYQLKFFADGKKRLPNGDIEKLSAEDRVLLDAMFDTLARILKLPDARTQTYALHGLGHLHHHGVAALVQNYIDEKKASFSEADLKWVEQCRDGTVM